MDQKRATTLEALEKFIQTQKAFLEKTITDIERLKELRKDVENNAPQTLEDIGAKLNNPAFRLSEQLDAMPPLPTELDWSVFDHADPTPFTIMAADAREAHAARNTPPKKPLYPPSSLREFVAAQRKIIVEPVLNAFRLPPELAELSSDDEPDPEEVRRAREREKIRELKKRRIVGDAGAGAFSGLGLRKPVAGVYIRRDQEDESAEVDISVGDEDGSRSRRGSGTEPGPMAVDIADASPTSNALHVRESSGKERKPTRKAQANANTKSGSSKAKGTPKAKTQTKPKSEPDEDEDEPMPDAAPLHDKTGKAKSETYKQAWSVSEQHLLERLLEEIPDGEKNRWAKISKAMSGRRTARQVASRVQKYYEKLKRFGVEVGGSSKGA